MKKIIKLRLMVQLICILLTIVGFFASFQITILLIMAATFLAGSYYCGWVCPYGTIQDLFSRLGTFLGLPKIKMPKFIHKYLKYSRYLVFALITLSSSNLIFSLMSNDPRVNFTSLLAGTTITTISVIVLISFSVIALVFDRPFCNYLCFEGAKYGLFSSLRFITIKRNNNSCIDCGKCDKACQMAIEVSKCDQLSSLQCINCFECTGACPVKDTLTYGLVKPDKKVKSRYLYIASIVVVAILTGMMYNMITGQSLLSPIDSNDLSNAQTVDDISSFTSESLTLTDAELALIGDAIGVPDGVYSGSAMAFRGEMTVAVTVKKQMITDVTVTDHVDDAKWFNRANNKIPDEIVDTQTIDISAVSGATYSSYGIIDAAKDALDGESVQ